MGILSLWLESLDYQIHISNACIRKQSPHSRCQTCLSSCPKQALHLQNGQVQIDHHLCDCCGECLIYCPTHAIEGIFPKRKMTADALLFSDDYVPSEKELLIYYKKGIRTIGTAGKLLNDEWQNIICRANDWLETMGELPFCIENKQVNQSEEMYTRRELFSFWKKSSQFVLREMAPANWRFNHLELDLSTYYPDYQFTNIEISVEKCSICRACAFLCPNECITIGDGNLVLASSKCTQCNLCVDICPEKAIFVYPKVSLKQDTIQPMIENRCELCGKFFQTMHEEKTMCSLCTKQLL